MQENFQFFIN